MRRNKPALRLAIAIHDQLTSRAPSNLSYQFPEATWQQCQTLARRRQRAQQRGWRLAVRRCERDLRAMTNTLYGELGSIAQQLEFSTQTAEPTATVQDVYQDLLALHDEFDEVSWDRPRQTLSVTTEPIELEGVYLGEFEIRLDWGNLVEGHPGNYRVVAIDAHPASSNEDVTHPHVNDEAVCEGDGRVPIRNALQQGRLFDFFVIVSNLLRTYNSGSPYVALSDWHGVTCSDCGSSTCDDERWTCSKCDSEICDGCRCSCSDCGEAYCGECIESCEGCLDHYCRSCLKHSEEDLLFCRGCLDQQERCDCREKETDKNNTSAPLQSNRVGEVAVPA